MKISAQIADDAALFLSVVDSARCHFRDWNEWVVTNGSDRIVIPIHVMDTLLHARLYNEPDRTHRLESGGWIRVCGDWIFVRPARKRPLIKISRYEIELARMQR